MTIDRHPEMLEHRERLADAPGLVDIFGVHQPADRRAEPDVGEIEQDQREQEVRRRQAEKAEEGKRVVGGAVLMRGRIDADRKRHDVDEEHREEIQHQRQEQPVADHVRDRLVVFEGVAEVALQQPGHPDEVLLPERLIEAVLLAQELRSSRRRPARPCAWISAM